MYKLGAESRHPALLPNYSPTLVEVQNVEKSQRPAPLLSTSTLSLSKHNSKHKRRLEVEHLVDVFIWSPPSTIYSGVAWPPRLQD